MKNVFIYGSLKKGFFNHSLIEENSRNKFIKKGFIEGYKLYILRSYPAIKSSSQRERVYVELYSLTDEVFELTDKMEKRAGYSSVEVEDEEGKCGIIYVYDKEVDENNLIASGNWTKDNEKLEIIKTVDSDGQ